MPALCSSKKTVVPAWDNNLKAMSFTYGFAIFSSALPSCADKLDLYVTESIELPGSKLWRVTDAVTGCTVCRAYRTRREAIEAAVAVLERNGADKVRKAIAKAKRTEGIWERRTVRDTKRRIARAAAEIRNARA